MKIILLVACTIAGESLSRHGELAEVVDVPKDEAASLTRMDRARYIDKADDPTKGLLTATKDEITALQRQAKAVAAEREARELAAAASTPEALASLVAVNVAKAVAEALKAPAAAPAA